MESDDDNLNIKVVPLGDVKLFMLKTLSLEAISFSFYVMPKSGVNSRGGGGELFRGGEAALGPAVRPVVAGGLGGCRLKMNCRPSLNYMSSASLLPLHSVSTVAFRFHSKFQFRQLSSESTVFTSSVVVRWFLVMLILHPFYIIYWRCY